MNSSLSGGASAPPPRAEAPSYRRAEARGPSRRGDEFERVLRDKAGARDGAARRNEAKGDAAAKPGDAAEQRDALAEAFAAAQAALPSSLPVLAPLLAPHPGGTAAAITAPPGARGAVDESAAARSPLPHAPPGALGAADAAAWQVHLPTPLGAGLELRATRMEGSAQAQPGWALSIASPAHEAALLARHAPRLDERLRARAVEVSHVRIERDDREPSGEGGA